MSDYMAYVATGGVTVVDIADPTSPQKRASLPVGGLDLTVSDSYVYTVGGGLFVLQYLQASDAPSTTALTLTSPPTQAFPEGTRSIAGRVTRLHVHANSFVVFLPKEGLEFTVRLGKQTEFIRLVFPFNSKNPPADATFTPKRELTTIENLKIGDQVFVRSSHPIRSGEDVVGPLEVQVLP
jgi:hypothetical protein